jgi:hypothetical protein
MDPRFLFIARQTPLDDRLLAILLGSEPISLQLFGFGLLYQVCV